MLGRKFITGIVLAATLAGGALSTAALENDPLTAASSGGAISAALEAASAETGLDSAEILAQLVGGTTLADIVTTAGGDPQAVIDAAVAAMTGQLNDAVENGLLTQARADRLLSNLEAAVAEAVNGEWTPGLMRGLGGFGGRFGGIGHGPMNENGGWGRGGRFDGHGPNFFGHHGPFIGGLLEDLGIDQAALRDSLQAGSTVAEAISAAGGDPDAALAQALAALDERLATAVENGRLTQEEADTWRAEAEQRLAEWLDASPLENRLTLQLIPSAIDLAADETGLTRAELRRQIADGATLADILTGNGVDLTAFTDTLMARAEARVNVHVVDGDLTQGEADALLADMRQTIEQRLAGTEDSVLASAAL